MNVHYKGLNIEEWVEYIKTLPRCVKVVAMRAFVTYVIGNEQHGLKHQPAYKYVSRKSAYGVTWFSDKQRRWFYAHGGPNMIGNNRTGAISEGWQMKETDSSWTHVSIVNDADGVGWVMGDAQARQPAKVGWRKYMNVINSNMAGAMRAAQAAVDAVIKSKGRL